MIVIKNALWLSICRFGADFVSLILFTVISRQLGPAATGEYSYAFALGVFVSIIAASGLDQWGIRQYSQLATAADRARCWNSIVLAQSLQLLVGIGLLAGAITFLSASNADPLVTLELSIFLIGWALSRTFFIPAMAEQSMAVPAVLELVSRAGAHLSALVLCIAGVKSLPLMLAGFPIAGIVLVLLAVRNAVQHRALIGRAQVGVLSTWAGIRDTLRGSVPFTACEALRQFYIRTDLVLIAQLLGSASVGWYATDLKLVEVGLMPLQLLGTASYPLLSRAAATQRYSGFPRLSEEFLRVALFVSGWLAVGLYCLLPLLIPALFGDRFEPSVGLLPLFAVLALSKGLEAGLYPILSANHRQNAYLRALVVGTVLIIGLNVWLIPELGILGAILAVVVSNIVVNVMALVSLRADLRPRIIGMALTRLAFPLLGTAVVFSALDATDLSDWLVAVAACLSYPVFGLACGLIPNPRRSLLFA